jgi:hypothetical protein
MTNVFVQLRLIFLKGRKNAIFCKRSPAVEKHAVFQGYKIPISWTYTSVKETRCI